MATESSNTKGNRYHDEKTGEFTSKLSVSSSDGHPLDAQSVKSRMANALKGMASKKDEGAEAPESAANPYENVANPGIELHQSSSIDEAMEQGNAILGMPAGKRIVRYARDTDLAVADEFNRALLDVVAIFPRIFDNSRIIFYGTDRDLPESLMSDLDSIAEAHLKDPATIKAAKDYGVDLGLYRKAFLETTIKSSKASMERGQSWDEGGCNYPVMDLSGASGVSRSLPHSIVQFNDERAKRKSYFDSFTKPSNGFLPIMVSRNYGAYSVGCHELGHIVSKTLKSLIGDAEWESRYMEKVFGPRQGRSATIMWMKANGELSSYQISKGVIEIESEALANYMCSKMFATDANKKIVGCLRDIYDSIFKK